MRSLLILAIAFTFSTKTIASVSGDWIGWVYWTFEGQGPKCYSDLKLTETVDKLHRQGGNIECDFARMDIIEQSLSKVGTSLMEDGRTVGQWSENHFVWTEEYSETVSIHNEITVKGNSMDYHEKWIHKDGGEIYDIKGRLFRK